MQPESARAKLPIATRMIAQIPQEWRQPIAQLLAVWTALILLFLPDWRDMAGQWWDSSTYNHILLVPPIIGWLASQRVAATWSQKPCGWWPGLVVFAGAAFLWMLGDFAGLSIARQLAVVVMLQGAFLALMGPRVAATQLFPLLYMLFLVPAGDELIPLLQTITARITMLLLALTHVPAVLDGVFITTPAGYFEVAEACSGVKFLIAMIAYGALVANVCFRSIWRRSLFMALAILVPIVANGIRAWGTIWIAGWYGIVFASSFDHVFYGWVFFAVVMGSVMAAAWRFFDRAVDDRIVDGEVIANSAVLRRAEFLRMPIPFALGGLAAICALFLGWATLATRLDATLPQAIALPQVPGWQLADGETGTRWSPLHGGADHRLKARFIDGDGHALDMSFALFASQSEGREAGGYGQGAQPLGSQWAWEAPGPSFVGGKSDVIQAPGPVHRLTVTWFRTGNLITGSNAKLKLANIVDRLLLRRRATSVLILSAEEGQGMPADAIIARFMGTTGPIAPWMDRMAQAR